MGLAGLISTVGPCGEEREKEDEEKKEEEAEEEDEEEVLIHVFKPRVESFHAGPTAAVGPCWSDRGGWALMV